jgi:putative transposase
MALSQSVASELLEAFRAGEGVDLVRESVRLVMQELIETEASERIGADRYERTETRITDRNGSRPRLLATQAGDVRLRIPKLRKGSFFPVILEPRRRIDQALYAVVMEAYVNGVSTCAIDDLVTALGIDGHRNGTWPQTPTDQTDPPHPRQTMRVPRFIGGSIAGFQL